MKNNMTVEEYKEQRKEMCNDVIEILTRKSTSKEIVIRRYKNYITKINELSVSDDPDEIKTAIKLIPNFIEFVSLYLDDKVASNFISKLETLRLELMNRYFEAMSSKHPGLQITRRMR